MHLPPVQHLPHYAFPPPPPPDNSSPILPTSDSLTPDAIDTFITRWNRSGGHERGAGHQFLLEFCTLLGLAPPDPPEAANEQNTYTFERRVERKKADGSTVPNWIDLYKAGHFVLETKQGVNPLRDKSDPDQPLLPDLTPAPSPSAGHGQRGTPAFDKALSRAHSQADRYIHALPTDEGRPPFLIVCDVGQSFDLYAEFSCTGGQYERFPDPASHRIRLQDLHQPAIRDRLRSIWTDPHSLDPSKHAAAVTREVAKALADLAKSLEKDQHDPQLVAGFLQRCLFTMFAEDVGLLPKDSFLSLLQSIKDNPAGLLAMLSALWTDMARGSDFSVAIQDKIPHFNGGLFEDTTVLPLRTDQIIYLIHAAKADWSAVEPAIFGTLLERALDPRERHKLGAHYTPRSYVERLVRPTIIEPLRQQWDAVRAAAAQFDEKGKPKEAREAVGEFHHELCRLRILDPACGSGNFLYVSLELLKRLEAEVLDLFEQLGGNLGLEMESFKVRPDQFLGLELNARAVAIAQLVLWIGYFQWQKKTTGKADTNDRPLLPKQATIVQQDAVLAYDEQIPRKNEDGKVVTIWDGRTTKPHPVTGKEVPDETGRTTVFDYTNPNRADWPEADYIVGNPPFIGASRMRDALGDGYTESLRKAWKGKVPESADFVMYWWHKAAELLAAKKIQRFGFITTNSIHQTFNRRVLEPFLADEKKPLHLAYAIPDHPWVDSADGAAVRIAMTVGDSSGIEGIRDEVTEENARSDGENEVILVSRRGYIAPNLKIGANLTSAEALRSNYRISSMGMKLHGKGFLLTKNEANRLRRQLEPTSTLVYPFIGSRALVQQEKELYAIDAYGLSDKSLATVAPDIYQHLLTNVKPEREQNRRPTYRDNWWIFGEPRATFRPALKNLKRMLCTPRTAKHRIFLFLDLPVVPESEVVCIAFADAFVQGLLSASPHEVWALGQGGRMGMGNDPRYNNSRCFETFPFPALEEDPLKQRIRALGEQLDAHRKARQAAHPHLTLTGMYNVLEKLRREEPLTDKDRKIHDDGLVTLLKQIHDDLDAAVLEAYGWSDLQGNVGVPPAQQGSVGVPPAQQGSVGVPPTSQPQSPHPPLADRLARNDESAELLEQELLTRLVALNHERAAEEQRGLIRWLRPDYQCPDATPVGQQDQIALDDEPATLKPAAPALKLTWPKPLSAQVAALQKLLPTLGPDPASLSAAFGRKSPKRLCEITEILATLTSLGKL